MILSAPFQNIVRFNIIVYLPRGFIELSMVRGWLFWLFTPGKCSDLRGTITVNVANWWEAGCRWRRWSMPFSRHKKNLTINKFYSTKLKKKKLCNPPPPPPPSIEPKTSVSYRPSYTCHYSTRLIRQISVQFNHITGRAWLSKILMIELPKQQSKSTRKQNSVNMNN